jgi:NADPH2:quinone reductase
MVMRAIVMHETGGPEVLVLEEKPVPVPGAGQVLVRIEVAAVSSGETRMRAGVYPIPLPVVVGAEAAGVVEQLGEGVDPAWADANVVMVTGGSGSYAEFIAIDVAKIARVPNGLSLEDAVASAAPGAVAIALLDWAQLRGGETVLVEGGSGKVGGYLAWHARSFGAGKVVATASGGRPVAGADLVVDHSNDSWPSELEGIDVAFDMVGGDTTGQVLGALTPGVGRVLLYGMLTGQPPVLNPALVMSRGLQVIGCGGPRWFEQIFGVHYLRFLDLAAAGETCLQPIDAILPLEAAAEAHRRTEKGGGRILLSPSRQE